jgi:hypothetical protein
MVEPKAFFDELMSPFLFYRLLEITFTTSNIKQATEFLHLFFANLFICEPSKAKLDVLEMNFGFQVELPISID